MLSRYRALFATPEVRATLFSSIAGRMPIGITGLAILLFVQARSGSFSAAGSASALYIFGLGVVGPMLGRLIDRLGPRPVLRACAILYPAALVALVALVLLGAEPFAIGCAALAAGATLPPVSACARALYPRLVSDPAVLQTAYSVDSTLVEGIFILGPALVAICVALAHPEAAVLLAALAAAAGTAVFMRAPPVTRWVAASSRQHRRPSLLRYPRLLVLFAVTLLYSISFGLFEVAVSARAAAQGAPAAAGVALALASVGSGVGAFIYGSRQWRAPLSFQLVCALAAMAAGFLLLVPIRSLVLFSATALITGVPMATVIATQSLMVSRYSPRQQLAESFTWSATCLLVGVSIGIALGGLLAELVRSYWLLLVASGSTALAAALAAACLRD